MSPAFVRISKTNEFAPFIFPQFSLLNGGGHGRRPRFRSQSQNSLLNGAQRFTRQFFANRDERRRRIPESQRQMDTTSTTRAFPAYHCQASVAIARGADQFPQILPQHV